MFEKLAQYAEVKYAGDQGKIIDFLEGALTKIAIAPIKGVDLDKAKLDLEERKFRHSQDSQTMRGTLTNGFFQEAGKGMGNLVMTAAVGGIGMAVKNIKNTQLHTHYLESLDKAIRGNDILRGAKREKVLQYANTIFKFAPNVATDVNVITAILTNAIDGDGIDPMTIKTLTELEGRFSENSNFSPKTYI